MMNRRQLRRIFRVNTADNLVVWMSEGPPVELLKVSCPECGGVYFDCGHLDRLTFNQLVEQGYARWVEQL